MKAQSYFIIQRWLVSAVLIAAVHQPQTNIIIKTDIAVPVQLVVDVTLDSIDPEYNCSGQHCSLRGAITRSNSDRDQLYEIHLPAGTYAFSLPRSGEDQETNGDLDIFGKVFIIGDGKDTTNINANGIDRVLHIFRDAELTIQGVTITGGKTKDGFTGGVKGGDSEPAGGIKNSGTLVLISSAVKDNHTGKGGDGYYEDGCAYGGNSGDGGGVYNSGDLRLVDSQVLGNGTGKPGISYSDPFANCWGTGGKQGSGGGIYNTGTMQVESSEFYRNTSGPGGGILNTGWLNIQNNIIRENTAYAGAGILNTGWLNIKDSVIWKNAAGAGGAGGGINNQGHSFISGSLIQDNRSGNGQDGGFYKYGCPTGGSGGGGGGIFNSGILTVESTTIHNNATGLGGSSGSGSSYCQGGSGGPGGGIYNSGEAEIWNSPVTGNSTGTGRLGEGGGSGGSGGGIFNAGNLRLSSSPVISNTTGMGGTGTDDYCPSYVKHCGGGAGGSGGGIYNLAELSIEYSPVISNTTGNGGDGPISGEGGSGGGIYNDGKIIFRFSRVQGNLAGNGSPGTSRIGRGGDGGGIFNSGILDINGAQIYRNKAGLSDPQGVQDGYGGGMYISGNGPITMTNNIIAENIIGPSGKGSGIFSSEASAKLFHTTLARNTGGDGTGIRVISATLQMANTIVVSQTVGIHLDYNSTASLDGTLWGSGIWSNQTDWYGTASIGTKNIHADPLFANPDALDYHIRIDSPAVDAGLATRTRTDVDNQPRPNPFYGLPDLGADEWWSIIPPGPVMIFLPAILQGR